MSRAEFYFLSCIAFSVCALIGYLRFGPPLQKGPGLQVFQVTRSIYETGSFRPKEFLDLQKHLRSLSNTPFVWQDAYSLDRNLLPVPKHSPLLSILALPLYPIFKGNSFLILSILLLSALTLSINNLAAYLRPRELSMASLVVTIGGSQFFYHAYDVPIDILTGVLTVCGLDLARRLPILGGFTLALSIFARPLNAVFIPLIAIFGRTGLARRLVGMLLGLGLFFGYNWILFGGPLVTTYQRMAAYSYGSEIFHSQNLSFTFAAFLEGWNQKLWFGEKALLLTNPALLGLLLWRPKGAYAELLIFILSVAQLGLSYAYVGWATTNYGNRYCFGAIGLLLALVICTLPKGKVNLTSDVDGAA